MDLLPSSFSSVPSKHFTPERFHKCYNSHHAVIAIIQKVQTFPKKREFPSTHQGRMEDLEITMIISPSCHNDHNGGDDIVQLVVRTFSKADAERLRLIKLVLRLTSD